MDDHSPYQTTDHEHQNGSCSIPIAESNDCDPARFGLPMMLRVLFITNREHTGQWLVDTLVNVPGMDVVLEVVEGSLSGMDRLRDESYHVLLVSHDPTQLDAIELIHGYRAGGAQEPVVVLGVQSEQQMASRCFEAGADSYLCVNTATAELLLWNVSRAVQRHELVIENRRLELGEQQRLQREHDEAEQLLTQQRTLIRDLELLKWDGQSVPDKTHTEQSAEIDTADLHQRPEPPPGLPQQLIGHYRQLLRTYVIMGSGNLTRELNRLAGLLVTAGITARQTMQLHVFVLEELVHGLGTRSTRHVLTRADLLVLEIMTHLAEGYRRCYRQRVNPPVQKMLPGFDDVDSKTCSWVEHDGQKCDSREKRFSEGAVSEDPKAMAIEIDDDLPGVDRSAA